MKSRYARVARPIAVAFWAAVSLAHGGAGLAAWALLPGGFPLLHPRFFANRVLPALLVASVFVVVTAALKRPRSEHALLLGYPVLGYPALWLGGALTAAAVFPQSGGGIAFTATLIALVLALGLAETWWRQGRRAHRAWLAVVPSAALGAGFVLAQRAPEPATQPFAAALTSDIESGWTSVAPDGASAIELAPGLVVDSLSGRVGVRAGVVDISVRPRLVFTSRSPDRFWTVFAPPSLIPQAASMAVERTEHTLRMDDPDGGNLRVEATPTGAVAIRAATLLDAPVYSHLNAFARLSISGHRGLGLRFSPCPERVVEVVHSEYPFGAPARLAYLDAQGMFRVVQASDAEKGPFTTLSEGPLTRGEPLEIVLLELATLGKPGEPSERELATIVFLDWSEQLSTELSPTAGWGLPQNAVEFGLASSELTSTAYIDLTLAGTSVGRGWDSVGHRAGVYTNRMEIRLPPRQP